jgi:hypothetical protein
MNSHNLIKLLDRYLRAYASHRRFGSFFRRARPASKENAKAAMARRTPKAAGLRAFLFCGPIT